MEGQFTYTFQFFLDFSRLVVGFASHWFSLLFTDLWTIINYANNEFTMWLFDLLDFAGLDIILSNLSIGTFLFSLGTITILIAKFYKP